MRLKNKSIKKYNKKQLKSTSQTHDIGHKTEITS
jgi:hypothetical protein